ncbi:hypothetical protein Tco_0719998 [Tanacetum coccineum]
MQAVESAYEAKKAKELAYMECKELEFLMIDLDTLAEPKATIIRKKQENIRVRSCKPKKKKAKKDVFTLYFNWGGIFTSCHLLYAQDQMKEVNDTNFDEMSYEHLLEIVKRLVPYGSFEKVYYCQTGAK